MGGSGGGSGEVDPEVGQEEMDQREKEEIRGEKRKINGNKEGKRGKIKRVCFLMDKQ